MCYIDQNSQWDVFRLSTSVRSASMHWTGRIRFINRGPRSFAFQGPTLWNSPHDNSLTEILMQPKGRSQNSVGERGHRSSTKGARIEPTKAPRGQVVGRGVPLSTEGGGLGRGCAPSL